MAVWRYRAIDAANEAAEKDAQSATRYRSDVVNRAIVHSRFTLVGTNIYLEAICFLLERLRTTIQWSCFLMLIFLARILFPQMHIWSWLASL